MRRWWIGGVVAATIVGACSDQRVELDRGGAAPLPLLVEHLSSREPALFAGYVSAQGGLALQGEKVVSPPAVNPGSLKVSMPLRASDSVRVEGTAADVSLSLQLDGARAAGVELVDGRAFAADVFPGVDEVRLSTGSAFESMLVLKHAGVPTSFAWDIRLGSAIEGVILTPGGELRFEDNVGVARLAMKQPIAVDAQGVRRAARVTWTDAERRLSVSLDTEGLVFPVLLDPTITSYSWRKVEDPEIRTGAGLAYDAQRRRTVLFGGLSTANGSLGDTWEWDGSLWRQRTPAVSPPNRLNFATAYDDIRGRVMVFGGSTSSISALSDLWEWTGSTWHELSSPSAPTARSNHAITYDSARKKLVLFGGTAEDGTDLNDTWEWDGTTWTKRTPASAPSTRHGHSLTYDANRSVVVMFAGSSGTTPQSDLWEWNGTAWTSTAAVAPLQMTGTQIGAAYDATAKLVWLVGGSGSMSTWNGTALTANGFVSNVSRVSMDTGRKVLVAVGAGLTSELAAGVWKVRSGQTAPNARLLAGAAFDPQRAVVVVQAGMTTSGGAAPNSKTLEWDGSMWAQKTPIANGPDFTPEPILAYDSVQKRMLAHHVNTYSWDGITWTKVNGTAASTPWGSRVFAFDSARNKGVQFGGVTGGGVAQSETWEFSGADGSWAKVTPLASPSARYAAGSVYDPVRAKTVIFGGQVAGAPTNETWEYNGTTWQQVSTATKPPARLYPSMAYDAARSRVMMYGGYNATDLWEYDGITWKALSVAGAAPPHQYPSMVFDGKRYIVFGGTLGAITEPPMGTWALEVSYGACSQDSDCPNDLSCTDGVCCQSKTCNTCETCNGVTPGTCTPVTNRADTDSCSGANSCDDRGVCRTSLGSACSTASECASGFCVDGVCCDSACDGLCVACKDTMKEEKARSGLCGAALAGSDVRNQCEPTDTSTCGNDGTCDGRGACRNYVKGTGCGPNIQCLTEGAATGQLCDGLGVCGKDETPTDCGGYTCGVGTGCGSSCENDSQCIGTYRCDAGKCVAKENASCDGDHTVTTPLGGVINCIPYKCDATACKDGCLSISDCTDGYVCNQDGKCVQDTNKLCSDCGEGETGCTCTVPARGSMPVSRGAWAALAVAVALRRRRKPVSE